MSTHNVPDTFANDDTIVDYAGGGADQQAEQVRTITNHRTSGVHEVHDRDVLEGFHNSTDFADLRSELYDVEHYDLDAGDACIVETQSAPWDPGRISNTAYQGTYRHAPSVLPTLTFDATGRAHGYASPGDGADERFEAQHAHSSTNGINQWEDFSNGQESPEGSYIGHGVESAPTSSPPPSVWSSSGRKYLSPATQSSQHAPQAETTRSEDPAATSTTRSVQSTQPRVFSFQKPSGSTAFKELSPSSDEVSVGPSNIADVKGLHVCFPCDKIFSSRSGLRHHRETHDEVKMNAYSCPVCQHGFRYPKDMERHQETHKEDREGHPCPKADCFKTFTRKDNLKRHLKKTLHG